MNPILEQNILNLIDRMVSEGGSIVYGVNMEDPKEFFSAIHEGRFVPYANCNLIYLPPKKSDTATGD